MKGVGVLLCEMASHEAAREPLRTGLRIASLGITDDALTVRFEDGTGYQFEDMGQSCCEHRYMRSDDKPEEFVGATFMGAEIADAPDAPGQYGDEHEVQFLRVLTDRGPFVASSHNEHNGFYGGFAVRAKALEPEQPR